MSMLNSIKVYFYKFVKRLKNNLEIIMMKNIDLSTTEGREIKRKKSIILTSYIGSFSKILSLFVPIITIRISRPFLGEEIYGLWSSVNSFFALFAFADLGLGSGLQTNLSKASGKDDNIKECKSLISSTFVILLVFSFVLILIFLGIFNFVDWASLVGAQTIESINLAAYVFLIIIISKLIDVPFSLTQRSQIALQEGYNSFIWQILGSFLSLLSVYLNVYFNSHKIILILCSSLIPVIVNCLNYIYYFYFSNRKNLCPSMKFFDMHVFKYMIRTGVGFLLIHIFMNIGLNNIDSFIVGKFDSLSQAGNYSICLKLASILSTVVNMFCLPLWGVYGEALSRGDKVYVKKHVLKSSIYIFGIAICVSIFGILLSPFAFNIIVGEYFEYNILTLCAMFLFHCEFAFLSPFFMILNGKGNVKSQILAYGIFSPLSLILKLYFVKLYGINCIPLVSIFLYLLIMYPIIIKSALKEIK